MLLSYSVYIDANRETVKIVFYNSLLLLFISFFYCLKKFAAETHEDFKNSVMLLLHIPIFGFSKFINGDFDVKEEAWRTKTV